MDAARHSDAPLPARGRGRAPDAALPWRPAKYAWTALALLLGLSLTWLVHQQQQRSQRTAWMADQRLLADKGFASLQARLRLAELLLRSVQSLFLSSDEVTPTEFANMYANLRPREQFPSLQALAYARREVRPDGVHYITSMVAPRQGNESIEGLDVASQPSNLAGLLRAFDDNHAVLSGPFRLRQQAGTATPADGVTLRLPIYTPGPLPGTPDRRSARARGSIAVSFRVGELIGRALPEETRRVLHVRVDDVTRGGDLSLYDSLPDRAMPTTGFRFDEKLAYGGRVWDLRMQSLGASPTVAWSLSILPAGVLASLLLALLVFSIINTRQRAMSLAWRMSRRYRASEERFRALNELLPALVVLARTRDGRITYANQASRARLGHDVLERSLPAAFADKDVYARLRDSNPAGDSRAEAMLQDDRGLRFWASVAISRVRLDDDDKLLLVATDITAQRELTERLGHQASHDALTGLYNRREFEARLQQVLQGNGAGSPAAALLYIDLDQFKLINDTSGHLAGDNLLSQLSATMRGKLCNRDVLARLGGDEFGVLVAGVHDMDGAVAVAERVRRSIDGFVFTWDNRSYAISASIGGVLIDKPGFTVTDVLAQVDTACYMAKELGRNRVHFHSEHDDAAARRRDEMEWANRLRWAVEERRLLLAYQEIHPLRAAPRRGTSVELLLRFRDDRGELLTPGTFMPAAERYGVMPAIDRWVVETALANFDQLHPAGTELRMASINLSGASIEDDALADWIVGLLQRHHVEPSRVCFEITETVAVRNLAQVVSFIERLRTAGCKTALDDFGAGMSSFGYLKHLPVDIIKIDGSFVRDMLSDAVSLAMVRAVADIGHRLGLEVVAEWVADDATVQALLELGVDRGQGFKLHRPELACFQRD